MGMKRAYIEIPDEDYAYLEQKVAKGAVASVNDAVRDLVREDRLKQTSDRLDRKIMESVNSGEPIIADRSYWDKLMALASAGEKSFEPPRS